jgi:hypothetical protein
MKVSIVGCGLTFMNVWNAAGTAGAEDWWNPGGRGERRVDLPKGARVSAAGGRFDRRRWAQCKLNTSGELSGT